MNLPIVVLLIVSAAGLAACYSENDTKPSLRYHYVGCKAMHIKDPIKRSKGCDPSAPNERAFQNIPILDGVYCFNNGTGICKAFAGRFEFYFNVWTQEFLGPAEKSQYVDEYGYHERVPISYMIDGRILYADRVINWSRYFTRDKPSEYSLLSSTSFNWCKYVTSNNWPYKSSILDHDKVHQIYFFNRQSCIYNPETKDLQHYNTRFLHTSNLRIDLDYNPTIFAMEDNIANETRLVKHVRQHWYEVRWELLKNPKPGIKYFVKMDPKQVEPLIIDGKGPLLREQFYAKSTDFCISNYLTSRHKGDNARLVPAHCGYDHTEIADFPVKFPFPYEVGLHSIPRYPSEVQEFYGVDVDRDSDWEKFAKDGLSFSATTSLLLGNGVYHIFQIFSNFKANRAEDNYDENYPATFFVDYLGGKKHGRWDNHRERDLVYSKDRLMNVNYVDDITWCEKCAIYLVVFGPLYTQYKQEEFNVTSTKPIGSIYDLGLNELTTAFFERDGHLYFYHRMNYISRHKIIACGGNGTLMRAEKVDNYEYRTGPGARKWYHQENHAPVNNYEEKFFQRVNLFKGDIGRPDAPDAANYPWDNEEVQAPEPGNLPFWVYILIALGVAVLLIIFIMGFLAIRRHRRRRYLAMTQRSELPNISQMSGQQTNRSGMNQTRVSSGISNGTLRSGRLTGHGSGASSGGTRRSSGQGSGTSSTGTRRSAMVGAGGSSSRSIKPRGSSNSGTLRSAAMSASKRGSADTTRSTVSASSRGGKSNLKGKHSPHKI